MESIPHVIVFLAADFLQRIEADVMVRDNEAVRGHERSAAARIKTNARFLEMLEPLRSRFELIFLFELFEGRIVEEPHPFIGAGGREAC